MFQTNKLIEDVADLYFLILRGFGNPAANRIMIHLVMNRSYNIQLVGATGVGKSSFGQRVLTNTVRRRYREGHLEAGSIAFSSPIGRVTFNIRECACSIFTPNLEQQVRDEWANTDAFFVMTSRKERLVLLESEKWIKAIRNVRGNDVQIVLVDPRIDMPGIHNFLPTIRSICGRYGNRDPVTNLVSDIPYVEVSSIIGTNIHGPFLALQGILRTYLRNFCPNNISNIPITPLLQPNQLPPPAPPPA